MTALVLSAYDISKQKNISYFHSFLKEKKTNEAIALNMSSEIIDESHTV